MAAQGGGASKYKGVAKRTTSKAFSASIKGNFYASYDTEELAAKAYDKCVARSRARQGAPRARRRVLTRTAAFPAARAWFLHCGDASGPNLGPLTAAELEGLRGVTLAQFDAAAKAARKAFAKGSSAYHGVSWHKSKGKWQARLRNASTGKCEELGAFASEEEAARAYDKCVSRETR